VAAPSLAIVELDSIAHGLRTADELVKEAPVTLVAATPSTPGRFLVVWTGEVAEVEYAHRRAAAIAGEHLVDELRLAIVHPSVVPVIRSPAAPPEGAAFGILELRTAVAAVFAADAAAKATEVQLVQIVLSRGLHGKGFVTLGGPLHEVEEAVSVGRAAGETRGGTFADVVLSNPDPVIAARIAAGRWGEIEGTPLY